MLSFISHWNFAVIVRAGHRTRIWCSAQRTSAPSGGEFRTSAPFLGFGVPLLQFRSSAP